MARYVLRRIGMTPEVAPVIHAVVWPFDVASIEATLNAPFKITSKKTGGETKSRSQWEWKGENHWSYVWRQWCYWCYMQRSKHRQSDPMERRSRGQDSLAEHLTNSSFLSYTPESQPKQPRRFDPKKNERKKQEKKNEKQEEELRRSTKKHIHFRKCVAKERKYCRPFLATCRRPEQFCIL